MTTADELLLDTPAARPCTHRVPHAHGTVQRYKQDRCRCLACREANTAYEHGRLASKTVDYGKWNAFADARPVRAHILDLIDTGMTPHAIAGRAHVSTETVRRVLHVDVLRMRRRTAYALLALGMGRRPANQGGLWSDP